jgi:flagellar hook-length control protein FliK
MSLGQLTANSLRLGDVQRPADQNSIAQPRAAQPVEAFREQMLREQQNQETRQAHARRDSGSSTRAPEKHREQPTGPDAEARGHSGATGAESRAGTPPRPNTPGGNAAGTPAAAQAGRPGPAAASGNADSDAEQTASSPEAASEDAIESTPAQTQAKLHAESAGAPASARMSSPKGSDALDSGSADAKPGPAADTPAAKQRNRTVPAAAPNEFKQAAASTPAPEAGSITIAATTLSPGSPESSARLAPQMLSAVRAADPAPMALIQRMDTALSPVQERAGSADALATFHLSARADTPAFAHQLGDRIGLMLRAGTGEARLILHPEALGTVSVSLKVRDSEAKVNFSAGTEAARAALEAALPQLKELLANQGVQLVAASTQTQTFSADPGQHGAQFHGQHREHADAQRSGGNWRAAQLRDSPVLDAALAAAPATRQPGAGRLSIFA